MKHVFLSYVCENADAVTALCHDLEMYEIRVWLDRHQISPGQRWRDAIRRAIRDGSSFIACFSDEYSTRVRSYMNEELTIAIDELRQRPASCRWFIPVLLSGNNIPDRSIGAGESLQDLHWVDLRKGPGSRQWHEAVRRLAYVIGHVDASAPADFAAQVQAAVRRNSQDGLAKLLKATARTAIEAALDAFGRNPDTKTYGWVMRPICEIFGNQFTAGDVFQLATRGGVRGNSRTGFHGLDTLYDLHTDHMIDLELPETFVDYPILRYYCQLRERFPGEGLHTILREHSAELEIDGLVADANYFLDKCENRGHSAFLDSVYRTADPSKTSPKQSPAELDDNS